MFRSSCASRQREHPGDTHPGFRDEFPAAELRRRRRRRRIHEVESTPQDHDRVGESSQRRSKSENGDGQPPALITTHGSRKLERDWRARSELRSGRGPNSNGCIRKRCDLNTFPREDRAPGMRRSHPFSRFRTASGRVHRKGWANVSPEDGSPKRAEPCNRDVPFTSALTGNRL